MIVYSSDETKTRVYETLRTLVNCPAGAARFVELVDKNLLARPVIVQPPLLDIVWTSWVYAASIESEHDKVRKSIDFVMTSLNAMFKGTDAVLYLEFVAVAFSHLTDDVG